MQKENINTIVNNLINRQFKIADIKVYLAEKNYSIDEIETVISEFKNKEETNTEKKIYSKQGLKGFSYIVSSIILFLSSFFILADNDNKLFIYFRILLSFCLFFYGAFLATRPLKNNLN